MKKFLFAMFVAVATLACFSSCSKDDDEDIKLADLAGYTFTGEDPDLGTVSITFGESAQTFNIDGLTGTYVLSGNTITLNYEDGVTVETITAEGAKTLVYEGITLKRQKK